MGFRWWLRGDPVLDILGHHPWFTPWDMNKRQAREWAYAMKALMPLQRRLCELIGKDPSPARLSCEYVLPRVKEGQKAEEIISEWLLGERRK